MSKKEQTERFFEFMKKWNFKDFEVFEKHYDYLMSLKNREQLMVENEAMKETIAELLGQKKTTRKAVRKQVCDEIREFVKDWNRITDENFEKKKHLYFEIVVEEFFEELNKIEQGEEV